MDPRYLRFEYSQQTQNGCTDLSGFKFNLFSRISKSTFSSAKTHILVQKPLKIVPKTPKSLGSEPVWSYATDATHVGATILLWNVIVSSINWPKLSKFSDLLSCFFNTKCFLKRKVLKFSWNTKNWDQLFMGTFTNIVSTIQTQLTITNKLENFRRKNFMARKIFSKI